MYVNKRLYNLTKILLKIKNYTSWISTLYKDYFYDDLFLDNIADFIS